jgi:hypothetical protein
MTITAKGFLGGAPARLAKGPSGYYVVANPEAVNGLNFDFVLPGWELLNPQAGTTYEFVLSDSGALVTLANADPIVATVPANSATPFPVGSRIDICQYDTGKVTVAGADGVTILSKDSCKSLFAQYSAASLYKTDTDTWLLIGDLGT